MGDQCTARECYKTFLKLTVQHYGQDAPKVTVTGPEQLNKVNLAANDKAVLISEDLQPHIETHLVEFLTTNLDTFAWQYEDITGISPNIIIHKLNIDPNCTPIQQKRRKFGTERNLIIKEEVNRLLKAGMIKEVNYPEWLANVVIVQKNNGK